MSSPNIEIGNNEVTRLLATLQKEYLCYRIAYDSYERIGDLMYKKTDQYEWQYRETREKLEKLSVKGE